MAAGAPDIGSLLAELGGGGAPPGLGAPGAGPPDGGGGGEQPLAQLQDAIALIQDLIQAEPDEVDKLDIVKALQLLQKVAAKDQQDQESALGGSNMRLLRKAG